MEKSDAAELLGVPVSEIVEVLDGPAGDLITTSDGQTYVNLLPGRLMFLQPPHDGYVGPFPVADGTVATVPAADETAKPRRRQRGPKQAAEPTSPDASDRDTGNDPAGGQNPGDGDGDGEPDPLEVLRAELGALDKDELLAYARDAGVDVQPTWAAERIIEVLLDAADPTGGDD